jgi:histone deacetylase 6
MFGFYLVSAGFDAAEGDELGECNVTPTGYAHMTAMLCTLAEGHVLVALEVRSRIHGTIDTGLNSAGGLQPRLHL